MSGQDEPPVPGRDVTVTAGLATAAGQVKPEPEPQDKE